MLLFVSATCPVLTPPTHGSMRQALADTGSVTTFSCNTGFVLVGQAVVQCQYNGTWNGTAPSCQSTFLWDLSPDDDVDVVKWRQSG